MSLVILLVVENVAEVIHGVVHCVVIFARRLVFFFLDWLMLRFVTTMGKGTDALGFAVGSILGQPARALNLLHPLHILVLSIEQVVGLLGGGRIT